MNVNSKSIKSWVAYAGYTIALTVALLYFLFPGDTIRESIERRILNSGSGIVVTIDRVKPALPVGLQCLGGELFLREQPDSPLRMKRFSIFPRIGAWLFGKGAFDFHGLAYQGEVTGSIRFAGYGISGPFRFNLHLEDIMLEEIPAVRNLTGRSISGRLSGNITYNYESGTFVQGKGICSLTISNGSIALSLPFLEPGGIEFLCMESVARLAEGRLTLEKCDMEGDALRCGLSGDITLQENIGESIVDIRGEMEPLKAAFGQENATGALLSLIGKQINKEKIPFTIRGTIKDPKVRLM